MELQDKPVNEKESLRIIEEMIASVKQDYREDDVPFILWGWLVFIAAISHYILYAHFRYEHHYMPWYILMPLGGIISFIYSLRKRKKKKEAKTYIDQFMKYLWTAFLVSLFIILFFMERIGYTTAYPLLMMIYGIGTFVTGGAIRFTPLIIGGACCWLFAIISFYMPFHYQLLLLAASILVSYIIPGHLLRMKK